MDPTDPLQNLPNELIEEIFTHLEPKELAELRTVSEKMNQIASDDGFLNSAFINPIRRTNITRVKNIEASNPEISNLELTHRLLKSVKEDLGHYEISTPISAKNLNLIEQQIKDASLVEFAEIVINNIIQNEFKRHSQTDVEKAKQIKKALNAYQGYNKKAKLLRESFFGDSAVNLPELDGSGSWDLKKVPEEIELATNLQRLFLHDTEIESLPDSIGNLTDLRLLNLSDTQLKKLPDSIGNLTNLDRLFLSNTQLEELPDSIGNLNSLQHLNISVLATTGRPDTSIKSLPESLKNLTNLQTLNIRNLELDKKSESIIAEMQANNPNLVVERES